MGNHIKKKKKVPGTTLAVKVIFVSFAASETFRNDVESERLRIRPSL